VVIKATVFVKEDYQQRRIPEVLVCAKGVVDLPHEILSVVDVVWRVVIVCSWRQVARFDPGKLWKGVGGGADESISLVQNREDLEKSFRKQFADGVNVVLDYLWGESARLIIATAANTVKNLVPVRFVNIGSSSGAEISLPSTALRESPLGLIGSGLGSISPDWRIKVLSEVLKAVIPFGLKIETLVNPESEMSDPRTNLLVKTADTFIDCR